MRFRTGYEVLEHEIREEQAATIGRLARELREALDTLDRCDRRDPRRASLVDAAAYALWNFVVQRECRGLRWTTEEVLKEVPVEVRSKMGAIRPARP
jgi:chemotaxis regulatin CheY-phosphate phosphatase CheZ